MPGGAGVLLVREKRLLFWGLILTVVLLLNLPPPAALRSAAVVRDGLEPFQNTLSLALGRARYYASRLGRTAGMLREKRDLEIRVAELQQRLRRMEHFEAENEALRRQLGFSILAPQKLLLCEVIARGDMSGWWQTVRINKGLADGVRAGMAVMTTDGLIGRTLEVSDRTADVLLITDPNCKVACKVAHSEAFGILRGAGVSLSGRPAMEMLASVRPAQMNYIPMAHEVREGDVILTSGLGGVFPEGLPVGRAVAVRRHESGLYQQVDVVPSANLAAIRYVFVVQE